MELSEKTEVVRQCCCVCGGTDPSVTEKCTTAQKVKKLTQVVKYRFKHRKYRII